MVARDGSQDHGRLGRLGLFQGSIASGYLDTPLSSSFPDGIAVGSEQRDAAVANGLAKVERLAA